MDIRERLIAALKRALNETPSFKGETFNRSDIQRYWRDEAYFAIQDAENSCPACGEAPCKYPCDRCGAPCSEDHRDCNPVSRWDESNRYEGSTEAQSDLDEYLTKTARVL